MIWIDIGTPAAEPVTLGEAKAFLRLERTDEDELLTRFLAAAREMVEARTGLILRTGAFRLAFEPGGRRRIELARRPVTAVSAAVGYGADGEALPADPARVSIGRCGLRDALVLPPDLADAPNGVEIEVAAGLAAEAVPDALKLAILRLTATAYETRTAVPPGQQPAILPPQVGGLIAPFRDVRL